MNNIFANLSDQTKGILLIIAGLALVLNYFGIIQILQSIIAGVGVVMIIVGCIKANVYQRVCALLKKDNNQQPPENF